MEAFKKKLQRRAVVLIGGMVMVWIAYIISFQAFLTGYHSQNIIDNIRSGFLFGVGVGIYAIMLYFFVQAACAIKNTEKLKRLHIAETDERKQYIKQKSGAFLAQITGFGLALGAIVAGGFNDVVFFTLLGACYFVLIIHAILKVYYRLKY